MGKVIRMKKPKPTNLRFFTGCNYVIGIGKKGKEAYKVFCNKMVQEGSEYCPKHVLIVADENKEPERRRVQRKAKKEYRKVELEALALSPLRAENPLFDDVVATTGYQDTERKR